MAANADVEWEIGLKPSAHAQKHLVVSKLQALLARSTSPGVLDLSLDPSLAKDVHSARATVCGGAEPWSAAAAAALRKSRLAMGRATASAGASAQSAPPKRVFYVHALYDDGPTDEYTEGAGTDEESVAWTQTLLPALSLDGHWESLLFSSSVKNRLLSYARSAMAFSSSAVDPHLVSCHRLLLLHGPPGTGKTSLCRALSHKLLARSADTYAHGQLIELNAHSLFSKWFSESGKLVGAVFAKVRELLDDRGTFTTVLVDEVESLAASRAAALNGSEPSDAVRVVNAVLTQLDSLKAFPNVLVLATSNITAALDAAFADRADLSLYIGLPELKARYQIIASCVRELSRAGVLSEFLEPLAFEQLAALVPASGLDLAGIHRLTQQHSATIAARSKVRDPMDADANGGGVAAGEAELADFRVSLMLFMLAQATGTWSGRSLRRLPLLAHAEAGGEGRMSYAPFLLAMHSAVLARDFESSKFEAAPTQQQLQRGAGAALDRG